MYTAHIKQYIIHSFLSLALTDGITSTEDIRFSSTTSLALCLADSLIQCYLASAENGALDGEDAVFDVRHQATQYIRWWRQGHLSASGEPGIPDKHTQSALKIWEEGLETGLPTAEILERVEIEQLKGIDQATSVVWVLPVALVFWRDQKRAVELVRRAVGVLSPALRDLAGWYAGVVVGMMWEGAEKKNLRVGKSWLGREFEAEFERLGLRDVGAAECVHRGVITFLETSSFGDGLKVVANYRPQASIVYASIAGIWYGEGVKDEIKQSVTGEGIVTKVAGRLGALAKILEIKDEQEMQKIAANIALDDELEGVA